MCSFIYLMKCSQLKWVDISLLPISSPLVSVPFSV